MSKSPDEHIQSWTAFNTFTSVHMAQQNQMRAKLDVWLFQVSNSELNPDFSKLLLCFLKYNSLLDLQLFHKIPPTLTEIILYSISHSLRSQQRKSSYWRISVIMLT